MDLAPLADQASDLNNQTRCLRVQLQGSFLRRCPVNDSSFLSGRQACHTWGIADDFYIPVVVVECQGQNSRAGRDNSTQTILICLLSLFTVYCSSSWSATFKICVITDHLKETSHLVWSLTSTSLETQLFDLPFLASDASGHSNDALLQTLLAR